MVLTHVLETYFLSICWCSANEEKKGLQGTVYVDVKSDGEGIPAC
jgi:hypothetical protein